MGVWRYLSDHQLDLDWRYLMRRRLPKPVPSPPTMEAPAMSMWAHFTSFGTKLSKNAAA